MRKISLLLLFLLTLFACESDIYHWKFNYSYEEIAQIKIIEFIDEFEYRELEEIDLTLYKEIYGNITNLKMKRYGTNLSSPFGKCFLIVFTNGEYDIISQKESKHFKYNDAGKILGYNSWLYCDEIEFNELVNKYLYKN